MRYASFGRRVTSGIIDYMLIFVILYTIGGWIILSLWKGEINIQIAPFMIMSMILLPLEFLIRLLKYPGIYGNVTVYYILFAIFYFTEVMYYSLLEISLLKDTIGHRCMKISTCTTEKKSTNTFNIILRNSFKTLSRYLFLIPLLSILFTKKKQTFYDMISNTIVVKKQIKSAKG